MVDEEIDLLGAKVAVMKCISSDATTNFYRGGLIMEVSVEVPSSLARVIGSKKTSVNLKDGATVRDALAAALKEAYSTFVQGGSLAPGILVLVNERDIRVLDGLDTRLREGDVVTLLTVAHGG